MNRPAPIMLAPTLTTRRGRVERGAALLDERAPDWRTKVGDLSTLNLSSGTDDILGRVFGSYFHGLAALGYGTSQDYDLRHAFEHGFTDILATDDVDDEYTELTACWQRYLTGGVQG